MVVLFMKQNCWMNSETLDKISDAFSLQALGCGPLSMQAECAGAGVFLD